MSDRRVSGSCLCGAVRFEIRLPTRWVAHCHCSICRRAHGAAYVTWVGADADGFSIVGGEETLLRYRSSESAVRSFCGTCGSPLFFQSDRWAGEIHVARASIPGALDRKPQAHAFFSDKADWVTAADHLPRRGGSSGTEPLGE